MAKVIKKKVIPSKKAFTVTRPAIPKRVTHHPAESERIEEIEVIVCDCCGKEVSKISYLHTCRICKCRMCERCRKNDPEYYGDHPHDISGFCLTCFELYGKYQPMIDKEEMIFDDAEGAIWEEWKKESLEKSNK